MMQQRNWLAPAHFIVPLPNAVVGVVIALLSASLRDALLASFAFALVVSCLLLPWRRRVFETVEFAEKACGLELRYANYVLDELPALILFGILLLFVDYRASLAFLVIDLILLSSKCGQFAYLSHIRNRGK